MTDFGFTIINDSKFTKSPQTTNDNGGSARWSSPEVLKEESGGKRTYASDVYSFGRLCLAVSFSV